VDKINQEKRGKILIKGPFCSPENRILTAHLNYRIANLCMHFGDWSSHGGRVFMFVVHLFCLNGLRI